MSWAECLTLAPGSDRIPVELLQILTQYAICRLPASTHQNIDANFPNLETLTSQSSNHTHREEPQTSSIQKSHPEHSNLNKMKRQRNIQQIKEHDKSPPNQTKEEEIGSLPEKKIQNNDIKMIQNLESKMELQINSLETRTERCNKCLTRT